MSSSSRGSLGDFNRIGRALSGYLAVVARPLPPLQLTAQLSRGFREPTLSDRYFQGVSGRGLVHGNPDLAPETSRQWDLSARWSGSDWRWNLFLYRYEIRHLVERFEAQPRRFFFRNRGAALLSGVEMELHRHFGEGLSVGLGGHITKGRTQVDGNPLDDVPAPSLTLIVGKNAGFPKPFPAPWPNLRPGLESRPHRDAHPGFRHPGSLLELAVGLTDPAPVPGQEPHRQGLPGQPRPLVGTGSGTQPASDPDVQPQ